MNPKLEGANALPNLSVIDNRRVEAIFISHAHYDHVGALPLLTPRQPEARIFMSEGTYHLAEPLLHNSVNVMKRSRIDLGIPEYPLYTHADVDQNKYLWQACHFNRPWSTAGYPIQEDETAPCRFRLHQAGHILGSASFQIEANGHTILYTGDINLSDQFLLRKAQLPTSGIDTLIIETTRGAYPTPEGHSRESVTQAFLQAINETFEQGGAVLVPIFALGKTQEIVSLLHQANQQGELNIRKLFIGGLGRVFSSIYDRLADDSWRYHANLRIGEDIRPEVINLKSSNPFRSRRGEIYLIPSGMMTPNTTSNRLASYFLSRQENSIFFVGYADPDSPAGRLRAAKPNERVTLNADFGDQPILCKVHSFDFTSHALREDLLAYIQKLRPRTCLLVHGDPPALQWFKDQLASSDPQMTVHIPEPNTEVLL